MTLQENSSYTSRNTVTNVFCSPVRVLLKLIECKQKYLFAPQARVVREITPTEAEI